jgi:hypothetical protein
VLSPHIPTHSRAISAIVRCLGTMPWNRVFASATVPANLNVETRNVGSAAAAATASAAPLAPSAPTATTGAAANAAAAAAAAAADAASRARAYPTTLHDANAFAKSRRRKVAVLFALLATQIGIVAPVHVPELLSATLLYFVRLPPAACVSLQLWRDLPATISVQHQAQHPVAAPAPAPQPPVQSGCRRYASMLTSWLDNELDTHLFRAIASLIVTHDAYIGADSLVGGGGGVSSPVASRASEGGGAAAPALPAGSPSARASFMPGRVIATPSAARTARFNVCTTVLQRAAPKRRWPVLAHHLTWFAVMAKFFSRRDVEAAAHSLAELDVATRARIAAALAPPGSGSPSSDDAAVAAAAARVSASGSSSSHAVPLPAAAPPRASVVELADAAERSLRLKWRPLVARMMLDGLTNMETVARTSRECTHAARRCAAFFVDALVADAVERRQRDAEAAGGLVDPQATAATTIDAASPASASKSAGAKQVGKAARAAASGAAAGRRRGAAASGDGDDDHSDATAPSPVTSPSLKPRSGAAESSAAMAVSGGGGAGAATGALNGAATRALFAIVLDHYTATVVELSFSVSCVHAVAISAAVSLDRVDPAAACVDTLIGALARRLARAFAACAAQGTCFAGETSAFSPSTAAPTPTLTCVSDGAVTSRRVSGGDGAVGAGGGLDEISTDALVVAHVAAALKVIAALAGDAAVAPHVRLATAGAPAPPTAQPTKGHAAAAGSVASPKTRTSGPAASAASRRVVSAATLKALRELLAVVFGHVAALPASGAQQPTTETAAAWLLDDVLLPFAEKVFGDASNGATPTAATSLLTAEQARLVARRAAAAHGDDDNSDDDDVATADAAPGGAEGDSGEQSRAVAHGDAARWGSAKYRVTRAPQLARTVWRSYANFCGELISR